MAKRLRGQKVLVDWSQNADFKTTIGVYSLLAKSATPFVSLPLTWEELAAAPKEKETGEGANALPAGGVRRKTFRR